MQTEAIWKDTMLQRSGIPICLKKLKSYFLILFQVREGNCSASSFGGFGGKEISFSD